MIVEMIEREYPHVARAIASGDTALLAHFGRVSAERRRKRTAGPSPLFSADLDPAGEFPDHRVLYRGARFILLKPLQRRRETRGFTPKEFDALCAELAHAQRYRDAYAHAMRNLAGVKED